MDCSAGNEQGEKLYSESEKRVNKGFVRKVQSENSMIILDYGSNAIPFKIPGDCYIYDRAAKEITKASIADITENDYVVIIREAYNLSTHAALIYR